MFLTLVLLLFQSHTQHCIIFGGQATTLNEKIGAHSGIVFNGVSSLDTHGVRPVEKFKEVVCLSWLYVSLLLSTPALRG